MKKVMYSTLTALVVSFASLGHANANDRQQCLNDCTQAGATQHKKCQADAQKEMIRCGQLATNPERNACKRQANQTLKLCEQAAREQVKQCQLACPAKR